MPQRIDSRVAKSSTTRKGEPGPALEILRSSWTSRHHGRVWSSAPASSIASLADMTVVSWRRGTTGIRQDDGLAQWAARDARQFAWVSLDHRDNDPAVLLTYIAEALNVDGTVGPAVFKGLRGAATRCGREASHV